MPLSFSPDFQGTSGIPGSGSSLNVPSSNLPTGEDVIVLWILTNGSPTPVLSTVQQLDSGASDLGSDFEVFNQVTPLGGIHVAWGTRHGSLDSLQAAFSTGFSEYGIGLANYPADTYGTVMDENEGGVTLFTETLPGPGIFAGVAVKGGGLDSYTDSTGDFASAVFTTATQRMRCWAVEAPTASETVTHESFSGTGWNRFHVLGHVDVVAAVGWRLGKAASGRGW